MHDTETRLKALGYEKLASLKQHQTRLLQLKFSLYNVLNHFREDTQFHAFKERTERETDHVTSTLQDELQAIKIPDDYTVVKDSIVPALSDKEKSLFTTAGGKIDMIKAYRERTGVGLLQAKYVVEAYCNSTLK